MAITREEVFESLSNASKNGYLNDIVRMSDRELAEDLNGCTGNGDYMEEAEYLAAVLPLIAEWRSTLPSISSVSDFVR